MLHSSKNIFVTIWSSLSLPFFFGRIIFERMGFLLLLKPWFDRPHCIQKRRKRRKRRSEFAAVPTVQKKKGAVGRPENCTSRDPPSSQVEEEKAPVAFFSFPPSILTAVFFRRRRTKTKKVDLNCKKKNSRKYPNIYSTNVYSFFIFKSRLRAIRFSKMSLLKKDTFFPVHL